MALMMHASRSTDACASGDDTLGRATTIRVLLADDHRLVRQGLAELLNREPDVELIGESSDGLETVALARALRPDVVVMDVGMPLLGGVDATQRIVHENPSAKVIGLSGHDEPRLVAGMLGAGAAGYVLKDVAFDELVRALRATMANQTYLSPGVAGVVLDGFRAHRRGSAPGAFACLTNREREIAILLARGATTKEVAGALGVSPKTVGTHREHLMSKLQLRSIAELTRQALEEGLI
jgi:DNA-binding NarL/FixJ family response regulator